MEYLLSVIIDGYLVELLGDDPDCIDTLGWLVREFGPHQLMQFIGCWQTIGI